MTERPRPVTIDIEDDDEAPRQPTIIKVQQPTVLKPPPQIRRPPSRPAPYMTWGNGSPKKRDAYFCDLCVLQFRSPEELQNHETESHEFCPELDCKWHGPPNLVASHRITHIVSKTDTADEALWLAARRRHREAKAIHDPVKRKAFLESAPVSSLEEHLRACHRLNRQSNSAQRSAPTGSLVAPGMGPYLRQFQQKRREALETFSVRKDGKVKLHEEFPICEVFLRTKNCRYGSECRCSHDLKAYREWSANRVKTGYTVKQRSMNKTALLYQLLQRDINNYEETLVKALQYVVKKYIRGS